MIQFNNFRMEKVQFFSQKFEKCFLNFIVDFSVFFKTSKQAALAEIYFTSIESLMTLDARNQRFTR